MVEKKVAPAPAPWSWTPTGKPKGSNAGLYTVVRDRTGRNIAGVWGRCGERELTAQIMSAAPELLAAATALLDHLTFNTAPSAGIVSMFEQAVAKARGEA